MNWLEENMNSIVLGDSYELIKKIPDNSIDLIITDPPYGINMDKGISEKGGIAKRRIYDGGWDNETPPSWFFEEMDRVSKNMIIFGGNFFTDKIKQGGHWIVWDKIGNVMEHSALGDCELAYTNFKRNSIKKYVVVQQGFINDGDDRIHPTQKPERLIREILKDYGKNCSLVVDFFSGSGTIPIVAKQENFNFIGIEKNEIFYKKSLERLNGINSKGQTSIFTDFNNIGGTK